jgi:ParB-like chromosome segregation protein Spo0J
MDPEGFAALVADLKANGMREPVTVHVEQDRRVHIHEGNHRLRAAHRAGIAVPVEVKYFGNTQQHGLVFPVES